MKYKKNNMLETGKKLLRTGVMAVSMAGSVLTPIHPAESQTQSAYPISLGWIRSKYGFEIRDAVHVTQFPNVDEQVGASLTENSTGLDYTVIAGTQTDGYGFGNAYLLNGLTDNGYWYQIGIQFNAPAIDGQGPLYLPGFQVVFNAWDPNKNPILFESNEAGMLDFNGKIKSGDKVELSLSFENGYVVMGVHDLNTGANATIGYNANGAEHFAGTRYSLNSNGFFTGPMLERYAVSGSIREKSDSESYVPTEPVSSPVWLWTDLYHLNRDQNDHFNLNGRATGAYSLTTNTPVSPSNISTQNPFLYTFPKPSNGVRVEYKQDGTLVIESASTKVSDN